MQNVSNIFFWFLYLSAQVRKNEGRIVEEIASANLEVILCTRVTAILNKRKRKIFEEVGGRVEVRKNHVEKSLNKELDKLKKHFKVSVKNWIVYLIALPYIITNVKDKDQMHSAKCLGVVKEARKHQDIVNKHVSI